MTAQVRVHMSDAASNVAVVPLRVVVHDDSELVARGLERMLAGHRDRVELLLPAAPGSPLPTCDLELYDPAYVTAGSGAAISSPRPHGRMVAYSWDCTRDTVSTELARGAAGFISKRAPAERLVRDLVQVAGGRVVIDVAAPRAPRSRRTELLDLEWPLTQRETDVLALIAQGMSNNEIAERLVISINSVKSYIRVAYRKIDVTSRSQAVLWGVRHGLLKCHPNEGPASASPTPR